MRIKLDENLRAQVASALATLGHDVDTAIEEGLAGCSDVDLWKATQREQRFLITQDLDFSDIRQFTPGMHHGILLMRLSSPSRRALQERILELFQGEDVSGWSKCFVVTTDRKVRIRRPSSQG